MVKYTSNQSLFSEKDNDNSEGAAESPSSSNIFNNVKLSTEHHYNPVYVTKSPSVKYISYQDLLPSHHNQTTESTVESPVISHAPSYSYHPDEMQRRQSVVNDSHIEQNYCINRKKKCDCREYNRRRNSKRFNREYSKVETNNYFILNID